jgi:hypothetical protein
MSPAKYFFDVPVYRLTQDRYNDEQNKFISDAMSPKGDPYIAALRERELKDPSINVGFRDHLWRSFGGCWRYNEIIGYIRLHFLGSQIRGEYFGVSKKRIVRTRRKILEYQTWKLAAEISIPNDSTSSEIFKIILEYLDDCRKELKGRYIHSAILESIGPYTDWRKLWLDGFPN